MTASDAASLSTAFFTYSGTRYFFNYSDAPTLTTPATLVTPAAVTTRSNCYDSEVCGTGNPCYRIPGYADGDFVPLGVNPDCATEYATRGLPCNGVMVLGQVWDGTFYYQGSTPSGSGWLDFWSARCDNTATGTPGGHENMCISGRLSYGILIERACVGTRVFEKTIDIECGTTGTTLWRGDASLTDLEIATTYFRTGGDDTTASVTLVHC